MIESGIVLVRTAFAAATQQFHAALEPRGDVEVVEKFRHASAEGAW
ncbi:hypothetical protein [Actinomadura sp. 9N407]